MSEHTIPKIKLDHVMDSFCGESFLLPIFSNAMPFYGVEFYKLHITFIAPFKSNFYSYITLLMMCNDSWSF